MRNHFETLESRQLLSASAITLIHANAQSVPPAQYVAISPNADAMSSPIPLDPTFGTGGIAETSVTWNSNVPIGVYTQPDGKVLLVGGGSADANDSTYGTRVIRLNTDGSLDTAFGIQGILRIDNGMDEVGPVLIQADGKILIGVGAVTTAAPAGAGYVLRLNADGSLDTSFGANGKAATSFAVKAMTLQANGSIAAAGTNQGTLGFARFHADGSIDPSFGTNGQATVEGSYTAASLKMIASGPDGRLLVVGSYQSPTDNSYNYTPKSLILRLNADGSTDMTFNHGVPITDDVAGPFSDAALLPDGTLLVANQSATTVTLTRYNFDGSLDSSFGTNGIVSDTIGNNFMSGPLRLAVRSTGEIVVTALGPDVSSPGSYTAYTGHFTPDGTRLQSSYGLINQTVPAGILTSGTLDSQGRLITATYAPHKVNGNWINTLTAVRFTADSYVWAGDPTKWATYPYETLKQQVVGSLTVRVGLDKKAIKSTHSANATGLSSLKQALHRDQFAYRAAVRLEHRLAHTPGQQAAAQQQAATVFSLAQTLKSDRVQILSFRKSGLHNIFAAEQTLNADITKLHKMK